MAVLITVAAAVLLGAPALRLIWVALHTGRRPELWAGLFFVGAGVGVPLRVLGAARAAVDPALAGPLNATGHVFFAVGAASLIVFTRIVFRPGSAAAGWLCGAGVGLIAVSTLAVFATGSTSAEQSGWMLFANLSRVAALGWAFFESVRYYRMLRRRCGLGLEGTDPVVTDRFRLWALWTGALAMAPLLAVVGRMLFLLFDLAEGGQELYYEVALAVIRFAMVCCAPIAVYGIWRSFFPSDHYLENVRTRPAVPAAV